MQRKDLSMVKISMVSKMNIPEQNYRIAEIGNILNNIASFYVYSKMILRYIQE